MQISGNKVGSYEKKKIEIIVTLATDSRIKNFRRGRKFLRNVSLSVLSICYMVLANNGLR